MKHLGEKMCKYFTTSWNFAFIDIKYILQTSIFTTVRLNAPLQKLIFEIAPGLCFAWFRQEFIFTWFPTYYDYHVNVLIFANKLHIEIRCHLYNIDYVIYTFLFYKTTFLLSSSCLIKIDILIRSMQTHLKEKKTKLFENVVNRSNTKFDLTLVFGKMQTYIRGNILVVFQSQLEIWDYSFV